MLLSANNASQADTPLARGVAHAMRAHGWKSDWIDMIENPIHHPSSQP